MSKRAKWNVWSLAPDRSGWIVLDEGTEKEAKEGAARRTANSARLGVHGCEYVALPEGEKP